MLEVQNELLQSTPTTILEKQISRWIDQKLKAEKFIILFSAELERRRNESSE
jgi:hypothetical protein